MKSHQGSLEIGSSPIGGAKVKMIFPVNAPLATKYLEI
jgi:signal transduction histidine kinase